MLRIQASEAARTELVPCYEDASDAETRTRYQMVLLASEGWAASQIAPIVWRSVDTMHRVLRRYQAEGVAGVPHRQRPGRTSPIPARWEPALPAVIDEDPPAVGVHSVNWTTERLADYLTERTGYRVGIETVRKRLHRADYVCKRPTWTLARTAEEQPAWANNACRWRCSARPRRCRRLHRPWPRACPTSRSAMSCPQRTRL
jgi:transposase